LYQVHPQAVDGNPGFRDPVHDKAQLALDERDGDEQLEQGQGEQRPAPEQGVGCQDQAGYQAAQGGGKKSQHGGLFAVESINMVNACSLTCKPHG